MRQGLRVLCILWWIGAMACEPGTTPIREILENAKAYDGKEVTVRGRVVQTVSFLGIRYYKLRDETGEIAVIPDKAMPQEGTERRVHGVVQHMFSIGDLKMVVIYEGRRPGRKSDRPLSGADGPGGGVHPHSIAQEARLSEL